MNIKESYCWDKLKKIIKNSNINIQDEFSKDKKRGDKYCVSAGNLTLDFSKNIINDEVYSELINIAKTSKVKEKIQDMFTGKKINFTEKKQALHVNLRASKQKQFQYKTEIFATKNKMLQIAQKVINGDFDNYKSKKIKNIIHIGIGGSFLGPKLISSALKPYQNNDLQFDFISNADSSSIYGKLLNKDPETTLFIIASKSFTTQETLINAKSAKKWLQKKLAGNDFSHNMIAITENVKAAEQFGIKTTNILPIWEWVGGRYSIWSAIGLTSIMQIGEKNFEDMLKGAEEIDDHFLQKPVEENLPIILGLIGILNINCLNLNTNAIIPYCHALRTLPAYIQQLDMESNGKSINSKGEINDYSTGAIIWGSEGTNGQHAFHQHLLQSNNVTPVDFILPIESSYDEEEYKKHQELIISNCLAQSQALMEGIKAEQIAKKKNDENINHKVIRGNRPSNTILFNKLTPKNLGALIAIYEHKVFTQGIIWDINSFDQWGVELGKTINNKILASIANDNNEDEFNKNNQATQNLINIINKKYKDGSWRKKSATPQ